MIENGVGYDSWMDKLLSASPNSSRVVLVATAIADHKLPDNPHVWYGIDNTETIAKAMTSALKKLDSADSTTFDQNLQTFLQSLMQIKQKMQEIKARYAGTPVGLTEDIYLYLAIPLVAVTETMPKGKTYQQWMLDQLTM